MVFPQIQLRKYVSPTQLKFPKQAGRCWISQMLYCLMFFQSVLDPIAHDYSQVQNCMHKQLQQQFTDCELNQPIVSTISCSLLIWKELGRWLPMQLASCGQLSLLVQFCTLRRGMCKSDACPETLHFGLWRSNLMSTDQSLHGANRACLCWGWSLRKRMTENKPHRILYRLKKQTFPFWQGREEKRWNTKLDWQREGVPRIGKTYSLIIWDQERSTWKFFSSEWGNICIIRIGS